MNSRRTFLGCFAVLALANHGRASSPGSASLASSSQAELRQAERLAALCTAANAVGSGLWGEYFVAPAFAGKPGLTRIDEVIDFDTSLDWPSSARSAPASSVRWSGWIKAPMSGRYRFHLTPASGKVTVARQILVGADTAEGDSIDLAAGRYYPVHIEIERLPRSFERVRFEWTAPHGARYVVPRALLHPPTEIDQRPYSPKAATGKI